jgi:hypothetical protein
MFDPVINEANGSSSACRLWRISQVETSTPPASTKTIPTVRANRKAQNQPSNPASISWSKGDRPAFQGLTNRTICQKNMKLKVTAQPVLSASHVMIPNERPSPFNHGSHSSPSRPGAPEETLRTERIQIERKTFILTLRENPRGRFLRITEDVNGRRDTIIVPAPGLEEFRKVVEAMVKTSAEIPARKPWPSA